MDQPASISAVHVSSLSERTAHKVSHAPDLPDQSGDDDTIKASSGKGSRAGSVFYSGSENGGQSQSVSVYQSVDLDDSDAEFELEVGDEAKPAAGVSDKADEPLETRQPVLSNTPVLTTADADSSAGAQTDNEFDYAFDKSTREGAAYQRVFKAQPAPAHLVTHLQQAHLVSLAEESEEGSDCVSEPESGLIQDDDFALEPGLPADNPTEHAGAPQTEAYDIAQHAHVRKKAESETDGMVEVNMDDDVESSSQGASFSERAASQHGTVHHMALQAQHAQHGKSREGSAPAAVHAKHSSSAAVAAGTLLPEEPLKATYASLDPAAALSADAVHAAKADPVTSTVAAKNQVSAETPKQPQDHQLASPTVLDTAEPVPLVNLASANPNLGKTADVSGSLHFQDIALDEAQPSPSVASKADVNPVAAFGAQKGAVNDEWEEVNLARAREVAATVDAAPNPIPGDKVRYPEALGYFLSADIKALKQGLKKSKPTHRLISCFMRIQTASKRLEKERTRLLCLAKMPFDDNDMMHLRLLQTVYLNFVGGSGPVPRYGSHWAAIGFQGLDPITDLRGCGVLGLLHLLLLHDHDPANAQALYRLSTTKETEFPLAPVSLNITKWTLQTLRDRKLSSAARKQQSMVTAASDFYTGTFYTLFNHWKDHKCTMADSGFVLKDVERRACGSPSAMVRQAAIRL